MPDISCRKSNGREFRPKSFNLPLFFVPVMPPVDHLTDLLALSVNDLPRHGLDIFICALLERHCRHFDSRGVMRQLRIDECPVEWRLLGKLAGAVHTMHTAFMRMGFSSDLFRPVDIIEDRL